MVDELKEAPRSARGLDSLHAKVQEFLTMAFATGINNIKFNPPADANPKMQSPEGFTMPLYLGQSKGTMAIGDEPMLAGDGFSEGGAMV
jgi:hypothetical protein